MKVDRLDDMVRGWFVGAFRPTAFSTEACEVAVQHYAEGTYEAAHFHKVATEITTIISGRVRMFDREWSVGDIITIEPGEVTDFYALTDAVTAVVKVPGALSDKFMIEVPD